MTDREQALLDYLQAAYPLGLRDRIRDETSLIWKYDFIRAATLAVLQESLEEGAKQLSVQTATNLGLTEWESFLFLPVNPGQSDVLRRATILGKLAGSDATVANIKSIVQSVVGNDAKAYSITENWTQPGATPDEVWNYTVNIYAPSSGDWNESDLVRILNGVHPAHCEVSVNIMPVLEDSIGVSATVAVGLHQTFSWGDALNPQPSDASWSDDATPLVGSVWS